VFALRDSWEDTDCLMMIVDHPVSRVTYHCGRGELCLRALIEVADL
jgi:hypothetical protein